MNLLLDTHAFLWLDSAPSKLSPTVRTILTDQQRVNGLQILPSRSITH